MADFDVIVIGGGPAGCYAGLTAAAKGCSVAIFEEHKTIGRPRHDPGWLMESAFAKSILEALGGRIHWAKVHEYRVCDGTSGDLVEKSPLGGYILQRDLLEREVAAAAVNAGAKIYPNTKVTGLIRDKGKVEGIETGSQSISKARCKILICADGIRSACRGFAAKEGLCEPAEVRPGISYLLANADVSTGVIEHFLSPDPDLNYKCFFTHRKGLCILNFPTTEAYQEMKARRDNAVSQKIKNAYPLEISGYGRGSSGKYAKYFKKIIKDNILFIGDASGGAGNIHSMIQGRFAGTVAASALKANDVSEVKLLEYQDLVFDTLGKAPFYYFTAKEDFGTFHEWFRCVEEATKGIEAKELRDFS